MHYGHGSYRRFPACTLALVLWSLLASGCSKSEPAGGRETGPGVTVTMNIAAEEGVPLSDAAVGDDSAIRTLWVYAFRGNTQIGSHRIGDVPTSYPDGTIRFLMDLELPSYSDPCEVTFYLAANAEEFYNSANSGQPSGSSFFGPAMSRPALDAYTFERIHSGTGIPRAIPMSLRATRTLDPSRVTVNTAPGHADHYLLTDPLEFSLQRCVGRVEMLFARESGAPEPFTLDIHSVTMAPAGLCDWGYAFPVDRSLLEQIPHTTTSPFYVVGSESGDPIRVEAEAAREERDSYVDLTSGRRYYCYENPFGSPSADEAGDARGYELRIVYSINGGGKSVKSVYLPATERNTRYRVWCCVPYDGLIYVNYVVEEWIDTGDVDLSFDYPEYEFKPYTESDYTTETHYAADGSADGSVRFSFMMRKGISWMPSLQGDAGAYRVNVYPFGAPGTWDGNPIAPGDTWYTIEVRPLHGLENYWDASAGATRPPVAYLTIVSQLWNRPSMKLEINPNGDFPHDGAPGTDYISYIKITQGENI